MQSECPRLPPLEGNLWNFRNYAVEVRVVAEVLVGVTVIAMVVVETLRGKVPRIYRPMRLRLREYCHEVMISYVLRSQ